MLSEQAANTRSASLQMNALTNNLWVDMSLYLDTLSKFLVNQSLIQLIKAESWTTKQQKPILSLVWPDWGSNTRSTAFEVIILTITPTIRLQSGWRFILMTSLTTQALIVNISWGLHKSRWSQFRSFLPNKSRSFKYGRQHVETLFNIPMKLK